MIKKCDTIGNHHIQISGAFNSLQKTTIVSGYAYIDFAIIDLNKVICRFLMSQLKTLFHRFIVCFQSVSIIQLTEHRTVQSPFFLYNCGCLKCEEIQSLTSLVSTQRVPSVEANGPTPSLMAFNSSCCLHSEWQHA